MTLRARKDVGRIENYLVGLTPFVQRGLALSSLRQRSVKRHMVRNGTVRVEIISVHDLLEAS